MTDAEYLDWLRNPSAIRTMLFEVGVRVGGVESTRYLCTKPYNTGGADAPAHTHYMPVVRPTFQPTEELSLTADGKLSASEVELTNDDGSLDAWLADIWDNRPLHAFLGDPRWSRADFRMVYSGIVAKMEPKGRKGLALSLRDQLQRLNTPMIETTLGGETQNRDRLLPLALGEVHNITPLLVDEVMLEYMVHASAIERIIEVRDNGIPVSFTLVAGTGKFRLNQQPFGTVTVSVQGDKFGGTYRNTVASLIQRIVTGYGKAEDRFTEDDIDLDNFAAFDAAHPQPVGIYLPDRTNVLVACRQLAASVGAQIVPDRFGKLRIMKIDLAALPAPVVVGLEQMVDKSLTPGRRADVVAAVKLGFNKNYTVQADLQTTLPQAHKDLYSKEWLECVKSDAAVKAAYKLDAAPTMEETALLRRADAEPEAQRRLNLWKVQRTPYQFEGTADLMESLSLGGALTLPDGRFDLGTANTGMVISLAPNYDSGRVAVGVLI